MARRHALPRRVRDDDLRQNLEYVLSLIDNNVSVGGGGAIAVNDMNEGGVVYAVDDVDQFTTTPGPASEGQVLRANALLVPSWGANTTDLSSSTGVLPVANGGTGLSSLTSGALLVGNGIADVTLLSPGADGQYLRVSAGTYGFSGLLAADLSSAGMVVDVAANALVGVDDGTSALPRINASAGAGAIISTGALFQLETAPLTGTYFLKVVDGAAPTWAQISGVLSNTDQASGKFYRATGTGVNDHGWSAYLLPLLAPPTATVDSAVYLRASTVAGETVFGEIRATDVTTGEFAVQRIPLLPSSKIDTTSGAFDDALIPGLDVTKITNGVFGLNRGGTGFDTVLEYQILHGAIGGGAWAKMTPTGSDTVLHWNGTSLGFRTISGTLPTASGAGFLTTSDLSGDPDWTSWTVPKLGPGGGAGYFLKTESTTAADWAQLVAADITDLATALSPYMPKSGGQFSGQVRFDTNSGTTPVWISRNGVANEGLRIHADDRSVYIDYIEDEATVGTWHFRTGFSGGTIDREWLTVNSSGVALFDYGVESAGSPVLTTVSSIAASQITAGTLTGQFAVSASTAQVTLRGTAAGSTNVAYMAFEDSTAARQGYIGYASNGNGDLYIWSETAGRLRIGTNALDRMAVHGSGNVSIGYTVDNGYKLDVNGTGRFAGLKKTSARWLKNHIRRLSVEEALEAVMHWQPSEFVWNDRSGRAGEMDWGFIADEVGAFFATPQRDAIDVDRMFAATVPVLQSHEQRIEQLERENVELRRELAALRAA